jgi:hypothetical protein
VQGLPKGQIALAILMILAAAVLALLQFVATGLTCAWDTSYCAASVDKNGVYEGTLLFGNRPYRSSEFEVAFTSRRDRPKVSFRTDERGHFCVRWASESIVPYASTPDGESLTSRDDGSVVNGLSGWRDLEGREPPPGCEAGDAGIPWNRAEDATSTWQYWLLIVLPLAAIACLVLSLVAPRSRYARPLVGSGALLLVTDLIAGLVLWSKL